MLRLEGNTPGAMPTNREWFRGTATGVFCFKTMPYTANSANLPDWVKKLPAAVRKTWVQTWNRVYKKTGSEEQAFQKAGAAAKAHKANLEGDNLKPVIMTVPLGAIQETKDLDVVQAELIREGTYRHPTEHFTVRATPERMDHWIDIHGQMINVGRHVTVPPGHKQRFRPDLNMGFVKRMWREPCPDNKALSRLMAELDIPDPDASKKFGTTIKGGSIGIVADYTDAKGQWKDAIDHFAASNDGVCGTSGNYSVMDQENNIEFRVVELEAAHGKDGQPGQDGNLAEERASFVFPKTHPKVTDDKDHFPINTVGRARNALARAAQVVKKLGKPGWYSDTSRKFLKTLRSAVRRRWPSIDVTGLAWEAFSGTLLMGPVKEELQRDEASRALDILHSIFYRLQGNDELSPEDRVKLFHDALDDVRDLVTPALASELEAIDGWDEDAITDELGIELEGAMPNLKKLRDALKLSDSVSDDDVLSQAATTIADAATNKTQLEAQIQTLSTELDTAKKTTDKKKEPELTPREKEMQTRMEKLQVDAARSQADADSARIEAKGGLSKPFADAMKTLLSCEETTRRDLATGERKPTSVRDAALAILNEVPKDGFVKPGEETKTLSVVSSDGQPGNIDLENPNFDRIHQLSSTDFAKLPENVRQDYAAWLAGEGDDKAGKKNDE